MTDRVDTAKDAVQPPRSDAARHRALVEARPAELRMRHHAMLSCGNIGHGSVACVDLFSHTENKSTQAVDSPPLTLV